MNYTFRMHDPRVGRFFAVDPLTAKYPWYSPYQFGGNSPIMSIELEGLEESKTANEIQKPYTYDDDGNQIDKKTGETYQNQLNEVTVSNEQQFIDTKLGKIASGVARSIGEISNNALGAITGAGSISKELNNSYNADYAPSTSSTPSLVLVGILSGGVALEAGAIGAFIASESAGFTELFSAKGSEIAVKMAFGSVNNAFSQYFANGYRWGKVNMMESGFSALPGYGATILGEGLNFTWDDRNSGITHDFTSKQALISIGGGVFSNYFGDKTGNYLNGEKGGFFVGEFFKFQVETATNVDPNLLLKKTK